MGYHQPLIGNTFALVHLDCVRNKEQEKLKARLKEISVTDPRREGRKAGSGQMGRRSLPLVSLGNNNKGYPENETFT